MPRMCTGGFVGTQLPDKLNTGFLVLLGNRKTHGPVKAQTQTRKPSRKLAACWECWLVYTGSVLFKVGDMGEETSYLRSTGETVGERELRWFHAGTQQERNAKKDQLVTEPASSSPCQKWQEHMSAGWVVDALKSFSF